MKLINVNLKNIKNSRELQPIVTNIIKNDPDIVVLMNYKREFKEEILHPLLKYMKSSDSECSEDNLIVWKSNLRNFSFDIKDTSSSTLYSFEFQEGKIGLI